MNAYENLLETFDFLSMIWLMRFYMVNFLCSEDTYKILRCQNCLRNRRWVPFWAIIMPLKPMDCAGLGS